MTYDQAIHFLRECERRGSPELGLPLSAIQQHVTELRQSRDDAHHVLVRHGVVPGADGTCRCNQCRAVAEAYAKAGYAFTIKDRWWEKDEGGPFCCHGQPLNSPCEECLNELARKMNEDALRTAGLALSPESLARQNAIDQQATAAYMLKQGKAQADRQFP